MPAVFSRLLPTLTSAFAVQSVFAAIFVPQQNEKYYDLAGAFGFLSTAFLSLYYPAAKARLWGNQAVPLPILAPRQILLTVALSVWSIRLGTFLAVRAIKAGGDSRFEEVKTKPGVFTAFWMAQATWVFMVGLPVYLCNSLPARLHPALGVRDYAALALFAASFITETTADLQKTIWRAEKENKRHGEKFITRGLWGISRHPNYVAEVGVWTGVWALASSALQTTQFSRGTALLVAAASPGVTYLLLRHVSGVPPLESAGDKKFGDDPKWAEYKKNVPVFWPWGSRG